MFKIVDVKYYLMTVSY